MVLKAKTIKGILSRLQWPNKDSKRQGYSQGQRLRPRNYLNGQKNT